MTTFKWENKQFRIPVFFINEDHEATNWDIGADVAAVAGCAFCFLPRNLYSVLPGAGFPRDLHTAWEAFIEQQLQLQKADDFWKNVSASTAASKYHTHIRQLFGSMSRLPPLFVGSVFPPSFINRIHPIMHNLGHIITDCSKFMKTKLWMENVPNNVTAAREQVEFNKAQVLGNK